MLAFSLIPDALHGGYENRSRRRDAGLLHDNVEVLFGAEVRPEANLVYDVIGQPQSHLLAEDAAGSRSDIPERPGVHECRRAVRRLHQVRKEGIGQQGHHATRCPQVSRADRSSVARDANDDGFKALPQVPPILCQRHDGHDFGCSRNHKSRAAPCAIPLAVQRDGYPAKRAVVHVHRARPADSIRIEVQIIAVEEVGIDERGQQILRGGNRVKIAVEMEIDLFAWFNLRQAAAGGASFHAEYGTQRRLPQCNNGLFPDLRETLRKSDGSDRLAFPGNGRRGCGDENEFSAPG